MPYTGIRAHLEIMRGLQAEESLRRKTEIAAGSGLMKKHEHDRLINNWRRESRMGQERKGKTTLDSLAAPGLPIKEVSKGG